MASSLYNLAWTEFGNSLISTVQLLHYNDELADCSLLAQGKTFKAHKLVLSAASPLLFDLFKTADCKHPVILVTGVQAADLEILLEFVYKGEVSVEQNQLSSLLQAAQHLNIQGLSAISHTNKDCQQYLTDIKHENEQKSSISSIDFNQDQKDEPTDKKKKQLKRSQKNLSTVTASKIQKTTPSNSDSSLLGTSVPQENLAQPWPPHFNLNTPPIASVDSLSSTIAQCLTPGLVGNLSPHSNPVPGPKVRVASDEPCACPLCGAILRQARNLRRHLLSSCKYRMVNSMNGSQDSYSPAPSENSSPPKDYHTLQPLVIHNPNQESQSNSDLSGNEKGSPMSMEISASHELDVGSSSS